MPNDSQEELIVERNYRVVRPCLWDLSCTAFILGHGQHLPPVVGHLKLVQVEGT
jgi:hypothetical protein